MPVSCQGFRVHVSITLLVVDLFFGHWFFSFFTTCFHLFLLFVEDPNINSNLSNLSNPNLNNTINNQHLNPNLNNVLQYNASDPSNLNSSAINSQGMVPSAEMPQQSTENDDNSGNLQYASGDEEDGDKPRNRRKPRVQLHFLIVHGN